ncbi:polysaccharide export outer membrane protein [Novosphingobium hassiacum]|uniref:Polysaccharide export outer membrane protein n=1 Tax=Novosphingobium hassiacum TaxID=173676 RepID=A0A7W6EXR6_9SPHN|nr:polysaccharide biosynthesis/export family protein [Novosphingobium hassiacum]MBB3862561.1 polysaccharide export outer membrane protein [Novosphingobium hassiacum]
MNRILLNACTALVATCATFALHGCASGLGKLDPLQAQAEIPEYRVDAGDKLRIVVQDMKDLSSDYIVDGTGSVAMPLIKNVNLRNRTLREAELEIEHILQADKVLKNPKVSIQPLDLRPLFVMGEVNRPGEYVFRHGMTVFAAVSAAGGYTYRANTGRVAITRSINGAPVTGTASDDTPVMPGDRIKVVERWF